MVTISNLDFELNKFDLEARMKTMTAVTTGYAVIVNKKQVGTIIAANIPNDFKGIITVKLQATKAMAEVREVTIMALEACLNV